MKKDLKEGHQGHIGISVLYALRISANKIIKGLVTHHIRFPTGKEKWPRMRVQNILTNKKYIENVILGKHIGQNFFR